MNSKELTRFNLTVRGNGSEPILFVHGYGCDQQMWRNVTPHFEADFQVILIDLIGSGKSDISAYNYQKYNTLHGYADDLIEICERLELKEVNLVGHSVSTMIGLLAVNKAPHIFSSLVMVAPSPCFINEGDYEGGFSPEDIDGLIDAVESNYLGWSSEITPMIMGNPDRPELAAELKESFCRNNPEIAKHFARVTFTSDNRSDIPLCKVPVLVLQSERDLLAAPPVGQYVHDHLPASKMVILPTSGHCPHMSAPEMTAKAIASFFQQKQTLLANSPVL